MKYFIDTEFLQGSQKEKFPVSLFRKHTKPIFKQTIVMLGKIKNTISRLILSRLDVPDVWDVFVMPKTRWYIGGLRHGVPYFFPRGFNNNIITIRRLKERSEADRQEYEQKYGHRGRNKAFFSNRDKKAFFSNYPMVRRCYNKVVKVFNRYYWCEIGKPVSLTTIRLGWKEKFDTTRFKWAPGVQLNVFGLQIMVTWHAPDDDDDRYWEELLWYYYYADEDIDKARKTWTWRDMETKKSTWKDKYLVVFTLQNKGSYNMF